MAEPLTIIKTAEKVLIWLHREDKTQQWLAEEFGVTRQAVSQKIKDNLFSISDIMNLKRLGCPL
jgi:predicted transcriptional regulator